LEFLLCFALAAFLTGGRSLGDIIHAAKGTTPPRIEKARLKAAARPAGSREPGPFREYMSAVWADAWVDAKAHHERVTAEKRAGNRRTAGQRARRLWRLLVDPVGEPKPAPAQPETPQVEEPPPDPWTFSTPAVDPDDPARRSDPLRLDGREEPPAAETATDRDPEPETSAEEDRPPAVAADHPNSNGGTPMTPATGEVQTYELHKAEIAAQRPAWQTQLDLATAAAEAARSAKAALSAQAEHGRALAASAAAKADGVAGAGLDGETVAHAGLQADAIDANELDAQFEALEGIEAAAVAGAQQAEAALAALDAEEATIDAKYGDAANTVASELGGDASYLDSGGGGGAVVSGGLGGGVATGGAPSGNGAANGNGREPEFSDRVLTSAGIGGWDGHVLTNARGDNPGRR
jgi:hypothetical protein